jgi:hypothetical protein
MFDFHNPGYRERNGKKVEGKAIPVTGHGGRYNYDTSRLPHFLENRLRDGCVVFSFTRRLGDLYPQQDPWYSFLLEAESTPGP